MTSIIVIIAVFIIALAAGFGIAKVLEKKNASDIILNSEAEAENVLKNAKSEAENIKKDKIFQAKEKFLELKAEYEKTVSAKDKKMAEAEKRIRDKESQVSNELAQNKRLKDELETKTKEADHKLQTLEKKQEEIERLHKSQVQQLEVISGLSAEEAKKQLTDSLKSEAQADAMAYIQTTIEEAKLTAHQEARKIVINTIQRIGTEEAIDNCVSVFNLESDEVKGRIGYWGRNHCR